MHLRFANESKDAFEERIKKAKSRMSAIDAVERYETFVNCQNVSNVSDIESSTLKKILMKIDQNVCMSGIRISFQI